VHLVVNPPIPAAQYLRVSTDHQQYSLENQADTIVRYAAERGFTLTKTYTDVAKSGLHLRKRDGLKQLLKDVVEGNRDYRAILVYDVSRWGRFQDTDESAHYEFLCKSAGVPVHYCAETFENDNSMPGLIMKTLKRTMAGEYSRELSIKIRAGLVRLTKNGFKPGGQAVYGMRRMLLDATGEPKRLLHDGERKCIANERVILVPGPPVEVAIVQRIFHEFANEHRSLRSIATRLNHEGVPFLHGAQWNVNTVTSLLKQQNYVGTLVWGRTSGLLGSRVRRMPAEEWVVRPNAFQPIIDNDLFKKAEVVFASFTCHLSDEQMLERLRTILNTQGKLSSEIVQDSRDCPGLSTYYKRIGGLLNAYRQLGYLRPSLSAAATSRQRLMLLRSELIKELIEQSHGEFQEFRRTRVFRALLRQHRTGLLVSIVLARCYSTGKHGLRWVVQPPMNERKRVTVLALLGETNSAIKEIRVFRGVPQRNIAIHVGVNDAWLNSGMPLHGMADLVRVIRNVRKGVN
jgi:DNA invertase Pin-like site-specific DNA recombinase